MTRCNIAILMAEQGLKITKISSDTGISRTTLTALANNYSQGIQFDTLNTLCLYLSVTPDELISFIPVDINIVSISLLHGESNVYEMEIDIIDKSKASRCSMKLDVNNHHMNKESYTVHCFLWPDSLMDGQENENNLIKNIFSKLPRFFLADLQEAITEKLIVILKLQEDPDISYSWGFE